MTKVMQVKGLDETIKYIKDNGIKDVKVESTDKVSRFHVNKEGEVCNMNVRCVTSTFDIGV